MSPTLNCHLNIFGKPIYNFKNAQLLDFHTVTPHLPPRKVPEFFLAYAFLVNVMELPKK